MSIVYSILATIAAYLLGSLSFAIIVSKMMNLSDPRTFGSQNPGATNVLRSGSKLAAILTLVLDAVKSWLPIVLVRGFGAPYGLEDGTVALVALAAFMGHLWPVFFNFKGGKGVATALGVLLGVSGWLGLATALTWLLVAFISRYSSLAALVAAVSTGGLPGSITFLAACVPIANAMGVPIAVLPVLLAVELVPDVFRTLGNVTADLAVTAILGRRKA